jgi:uncharacterized protein YciI
VGARNVAVRTHYPGGVADYQLVTLTHGPGWDHRRPRRDQGGWEEHAAFMDALVDEGLVVLGGPVGDGDGDDVLLVMEMDGEEAIRACLADDPWMDGVLAIESIRPWSVWLRAGA